jgi:hypothetical protein
MDFDFNISGMFISWSNAPPHDFERSENIMQAVVGAASSFDCLLPWTA